MRRYVKIDNDGIPIEEAWTEFEPPQDFFEVPDDLNLSNKKYVDGEWVDIVPNPMENALSDEEQAMLEMQTNVEYLVELAEMNMEV